MKTRKTRKGIVAFVLAAVLFVSMLSGVQAAGWVDTDSVYSIELSVDAGEFTDSTVAVTAGLYQVAEMTRSGSLKLKEDFKTLESSVSDSEGAATALAKRAEDASAIIADKGLSPDATVEIQNGTGKAENLAPGLYLVAGETGAAPIVAESGRYRYEFTSCLVSIPYNEYQADPTKDDAWIKDVKLALKYSREDLYGNLKIEKTLTTYNTTLGPVSFLFQVEAVKEDGRPQPKVYSNVVALSFDGPGTKSVTVEDIPAGATVSVTELSASGSYSPAAGSGSEQTTEILQEKEVSVTFKNEYNNGMTGSHTIVNQFTNKEDGKGTWTWTQITDGAQTVTGEVQGKAPVQDAGGDGEQTTGGMAGEGGIGQ